MHNLDERILDAEIQRLEQLPTLSTQEVCLLDWFRRQRLNWFYEHRQAPGPRSQEKVLKIVKEAFDLEVGAVPGSPEESLRDAIAVRVVAALEGTLPQQAAPERKSIRARAEERARAFVLAVLAQRQGPWNEAEGCLLMKACDTITEAFVEGHAAGVAERAVADRIARGDI